MPLLLFWIVWLVEKEVCRQLLILITSKVRLNDEIALEAKTT